jgi:hypothetical protein
MDRFFVEVAFGEQVKLAAATKDGQYFVWQRFSQLAHLKRAKPNADKLHSD